MKKILFVTHEAKRSGAPLYLYGLISEFVKFDKFEISVLIQSNGELEEDFSKYASIYKYIPDFLRSKSIVIRTLLKILGRNRTLKLYQKNLVKNIDNQNFDIIYFNSLASFRTFNLLKKLESKKIVHVHELEMVIKGFDQASIETMLRESDRIISSQRCISKMLLTTYEIDPKKLIENNVFLNPIMQLKIDGFEKGKEKARFVIGGSGPVEKRKGTDIFIDFAIRFLKLHTNLPIDFIWIGNNSSSLYEILKNKLKAEGLTDRIFFTGKVTNPEEHFTLLSTFFLSSREEAFGLVALENAYAGVPLISFNIDGDLPLFINKFKCGSVIEMNDFEAFEKFILNLYGDGDLLKEYGRKGKQGVIKEFLVDEQVGKIAKEIISL
ncbi:glycosyltransferase family 4 protein [Robertkochia solimangrovi]|uniref:glycosyltransferase family 4 protein n=1 Tax=Robertkochia solimangrovi TaxID=2213046 RepID=UPI00117D0E0E|nr:glycosyltransferase family 4 protein [Robertkochia solimangrovi]TRZ44981.1 hypothetical protein DMZ48_04260 [Robertkochia solimangrovi]